MTTPTPLWTDDERPWVNEYMNASSKLGMAARTISRWGKDWHKEGKDEGQYQSAHNDIADMADAITSLLIERDEYEADRATQAARIAELERTLEWVCEPRLEMDEMHRRHREAGNELKQRKEHDHE